MTRAPALAALLLLCGCADLKVTQVTNQNRASVVGQHYYLPKPVVIVAPQADGSIAVTVDYLPDRAHEYAIDTDTTMSTYTYQAQTDIRGLLTQVEFKADTTPVGQQIAASTSAATVQYANYQSAQMVASQTAVNTAQAAVDTAKAASDAAKAAQTSDQQSPGVLPSTLASDASTAAQADAKLAVAQAALDRARTSAQVVAAGATAATPLTIAGPTLGTMTAQTWSGPAAISTPDKFAPVMFLVNDNYTIGEDGKGTGTVSLSAVTSTLNGSVPGTDLEKGVVPAAQPTFATAVTALGQPALLPVNQTVPLAAKTVTFVYDRAIKAIALPVVATDAKPAVPQDASVKLSDDGKTVTIDTTKLKAGSYQLTTSISYLLNSTGTIWTSSSTVKFTLK